MPMSIYANDEIIIVSVIQDKYGNITETDSDPIECRIKDNNKLIIDALGQEVLGELYVHFIPTSINIKYGDKLKINKRWGKAYIDPNKKFKIKKIELCGDFQQHYQGVYI